MQIPLLSQQQIEIIKVIYGAPKCKIAVVREKGHKWTELMYVLESLRSLYITYTDKNEQTPEHEKIVFGLSPVGLVIATLMFGPPDAGLPKWMPPVPKKPVILNAGQMRK